MSDQLLQIKDLLGKQSEAFAKFKAANDARFNELEKMNNRQKFGGASSASGETPEASEHRKAFAKFARKGVDDGLLSLEINAALSTGSDPDGGFAVPKIIDNEIEKLLIDQSPMRRICRVIQAGSPDYHKLVSTGGLSSGWVGELEARPETNTRSLAKLTPFWGEIYANPAASQNSLDDIGFDVEAFLTEGIVDEFSLQEGAALITGNGIKKPKGLLEYPTTATADSSRPFGTIQHVVSGEANGFAAASTTVSPADCLVNLLHAVRKGYRQGAVWLMNSNTLATVSKFKDADGAPIWRLGLADGEPNTILGYKVEEDENMPDVAAGKFPIAFGNFKRGVIIVDRTGTRILRDPYSNKPYVHFYATRRVGSFLNNSQAVKLLKIST
jgi:HK97 family phage major capsid protein